MAREDIAISVAGRATSSRTTARNSRRRSSSLVPPSRHPTAIRGHRQVRQPRCRRAVHPFDENECMRLLPIVPLARTAFAREFEHYVAGTTRNGRTRDSAPALPMRSTVPSRRADAHASSRGRDGLVARRARDRTRWFEDGPAHSSSCGSSTDVEDSICPSSRSGASRKASPDLSPFEAQPGRCVLVASSASQIGVADGSGDGRNETVVG